MRIGIHDEINDYRGNCFFGRGIDAGIDGPIVLAADPAPGAVLAGSPFVIRLGLSGALFQSLLRNPLGSPDIMGFNTGAYSGVKAISGMSRTVTSAYAFATRATVGSDSACVVPVCSATWRPTVVRVSWADPTRIGWPLARDARRRPRRRDRSGRARGELS